MILAKNQTRQKLERLKGDSAERTIACDRSAKSLRITRFTFTGLSYPVNVEHYSLKISSSEAKFIFFSEFLVKCKNLRIFLFNLKQCGYNCYYFECNSEHATCMQKNLQFF